MSDSTKVAELKNQLQGLLTAAGKVWKELDAELQEMVADENHPAGLAASDLLCSWDTLEDDAGYVMEQLEELVDILEHPEPDEG